MTQAAFFVGLEGKANSVTQQFWLEGSGQERKMAQGRNDTRRQAGKAPEYGKVIELEHRKMQMASELGLLDIIPDRSRKGGKPKRRG